MATYIHAYSIPCDSVYNGVHTDISKTSKGEKMKRQPVEMQEGKILKQRPLDGQINNVESRVRQTETHKIHISFITHCHIQIYFTCHIFIVYVAVFFTHTSYALYLLTRPQRKSERVCKYTSTHCNKKNSSQSQLLSLLIRVNRASDIAQIFATHYFVVPLYCAKEESIKRIASVFIQNFVAKCMVYTFIIVNIQWNVCVRMVATYEICGY